MNTSSMKSDSTQLQMPEYLDREWVSSNRPLLTHPNKSLTLDFIKMKKMDSAGISLVRLLQKHSHDTGGQLILKNITQEHLTILQSWGANQAAVQPEKREPFAAQIGTSLVQTWELVLNALSVLAEMLYWGTIGLLHKRDMRKGTLGEQMYQLGFRAFFIVILLAFLIGLVLALQTAMQLDVYGAGVFLAPLIGITMIREFGPLMTAIILAGRTGSATTAEIATMGVGEEIDALRTMGINPIQFIVVPKFWAISITMPILSIMATVAGIIGGFLVAVLYLNLAPSLFWNELVKSIHFRDVFAGFSKSIVFAWLIIWIGSFYGFKVRGGAEAVGKETTASVVTGIFIIIIADALFSFILP